MTLQKQLENILGGIEHIQAELALCIGLLLFIVLGLIVGERHKNILPIFATLVLAITGYFVIQHLQVPNEQAKQVVYGGMITQTKIASYFKLLSLLVGFLTIIFTKLSYRKASEVEGGFEYYILLLGGILGINLMFISTNLLMLFLAIETVSLTSYALVLFKNDVKSKESGVKYLLYGLFITGFMIYGMSLIYVFTGSLNYTDIIDTISVGKPSLLFIIGMFFMLMGTFFKLSLAPFHSWAPDVYEGSPMPIVAYLSVGPKLGGLVALCVFLSTQIEVSVIQNFRWKEILAILSIITMIIGNFSALLQSNVKRMLAYSSIAHAGFLLIGFIAFSDFGIESLLFYASIYLLMNYSIFLLVDVFVTETQSEEMKDFAGLGLKNPFLGVLTVITILSLIGLPPTAGFSAKLFIFTALWETSQQEMSQLLYYLVIIGLFNAVIALFYYIKIPFYLFFRKGEKTENSINLTISHKVVLLLTTLPLLVFFVSPTILLELFHYLNHLAKYFL